MFRSRTTVLGLRKQLLSRVALSTIIGTLLVPMSGCARSNELNLFGAYFPVWLLALVIGAATAFGCRFLFVRYRVEPFLGPLTLIYLCITISVSCLVYLIFA